MQDQRGRVVLVTGATSGLGLSSATALARRGAHVLLAGRDRVRTERAVEEVGAAAASGAVGGSAEPLMLDLASLASVRAAAEQVLASGRLDVLMNNAGVMATPRGRTVDGFETQIGTNHLGHFALTGLLLPLLLQSADGRVVTVASGAHRMGRLDVDDLNFERRRYEPWTAYGQSKLANLLFTAELARRLHVVGATVRAVAAHPGWTATNLQLAGPAVAQNPVGRAGTRLMNRLVGQRPEQGALPQLYAATMPDVRSGDYFGPDGIAELRGGPTRVAMSEQARDSALAQRLWTMSEQLTGVRGPLADVG
jgi:NAD(P)-dependent dehydrogenase (short-subunit alcohol dehydrogenase family)